MSYPFRLHVSCRTDGLVSRVAADGAQSALPLVESGARILRRGIGQRPTDADLLSACVGEVPLGIQEQVQRHMSLTDISRHTEKVACPSLVGMSQLKNGS